MNNEGKFKQRNGELYMKYLKKVQLMLMTVLMLLSVLACTHAVYGVDYLPYNDPGQFVKMSDKPVPVIIKFPNGLTKLVNIIYYNGRICMPLVSTLDNMGAELDRKNQYSYKITYEDKTVWVPVKPADSNRCVMVYKDGTGYISMYSLLEPLGLTPVFEPEKNKITIYKKDNNMTNEQLERSIGTSPAYIRLEDIMADGVDKNPSYTAERLEKLMYMAEYLYLRGQEYYIAWIPVYKNPATGCTNNISLDYNLYNSCFVYTLDYMIDHGGHIGLHGYTHQYGSDKSAGGYEWGDKTPYSFREQQQRMINAKIVASRLGYEPEFFEFPHYGATEEQLRMAEHYFDVIYQAYPKQSVMNIITYTDTSEGKRVYYIPTPADYVYHVADGDNAVARLRSSASKGHAVSIFYHPTLDLRERDYMQVASNDNKMVRTWYLSEEAILTKLVNNIREMGFRFTHIN